MWRNSFPHDSGVKLSYHSLRGGLVPFEERTLCVSQETVVQVDQTPQLSEILESQTVSLPGPETVSGDPGMGLLNEVRK
jgi:hypothetical protein